MDSAGNAKHMNVPSGRPSLTAQKDLSVPEVRQENSRARLSIVEPGETRGRETDSLRPDRRVGVSVFTFWRGRVALYAILKALGIGRGDSVVVPGYTCFAVPSAVCFAGAEPVYADIESSTFNLSLTTILSALRSKPCMKVKAILIQHTYGIPADTHPVVSWAWERGIATIEDCAHVWGSRYRDGFGEWVPVGTQADAAFFSSQWTKPVSTGLGGWVETKNPRLGEKLRSFRSEQCVSPTKAEVLRLATQLGIRSLLSHPRVYWIVKNTYQALYYRGLLVGTSSKEELRGAKPEGYAKRMSSFQRWLLKRLLTDDSLVEHRRGLKRIYDAALKSAGLPILEVPKYADAVLLRYPVRVGHKARVLREAKKHGIELGDWYTHPIDRPKGLEAEAFGYQPGTCPEGERAGQEVINLPMRRNVTEESARRMVEFVKELA